MEVTRRPSELKFFKQNGLIETAIHAGSRCAAVVADAGGAYLVSGQGAARNRTIFFGYALRADGMADLARMRSCFAASCCPALPSLCRRRATRASPNKEEDAGERRKSKQMRQEESRRRRIRTEEKAGDITTTAGSGSRGQEQQQNILPAATCGGFLLPAANQRRGGEGRVEGSGNGPHLLCAAAG